MPMKSIHTARILLLADGDKARFLADMLARMNLTQVGIVADLQEAQRLCEAGEVEICLVADAKLSWAISHDVSVAIRAPGLAQGTPSLLLTDAITPGIRTLAHECGYVEAVPISVAPRVLYRMIGGLLQKQPARAADRGLRSGHAAKRLRHASLRSHLDAFLAGDSSKVTLH
jgi:hypothetical protein